jgi:hypothetical protein
MAAPLQKKTGDCEVCTRPEGIEAKLTLMHGNIWMCPTCCEEDTTLTTQTAKNVIDFSRKIDTQVVLKQDVFNAGTISFIELQAAIENNAEIPAEKKNLSLMQEVAARIETLNAAIFSEEAALIAKKNERHALLINAQNVAARLHAVEREKFKQYDITYQPAKPKTTKPKAVKAPAKFDKTAVFEAAKKYNVPAAQVQSLIVSKNLSAEDAAKHMATLLGLI